MSYRGRPNWPPEWIPTPAQNDRIASGEVGILEEVYCPSTLDSGRCYLTISFEGHNYIGVLRFDESDFCRRISSLLSQHTDHPISAIGDLDVT